MADIKLDGQTLATASGSTITLNSGVQFPAGVEIGNCSLWYANTSGQSGSTNAWSLRNMDVKTHTSNCAVTFSSNRWSFDQSGSYVMDAILSVYRTDYTRLAFGVDGSITFYGLWSAYVSSEVGSGLTACNGYRFDVLSSEITGGASEKLFGLYLWSSNGGGTYVTTSGTGDHKNSMVTIKRVG